jgi:hypothetical protein
MKRISVVFIAMLVLVAIPATAQHRIGFIGGLNLANVSVDPEETGIEYSNRTAFGGGGVLDLRLAENIALQLEPMFLQKGTKVTDGSDEVKVKLSYIEVPVLLKFMLGQSPTRPYIMAGPSAGFRLSAKVSNGGEIDIKDVIKSTDFGLDFGAGISFPAGNNAIFVEGRYGLGLSNINDDPTDTNTDVKNKGIQFMAGITFPLGSGQ